MRLFLLIFLVVFLSSCGRSSNVGNILGLDRRPPDEFSVVSRPPLTLPPDFTLSPDSGADAATDDGGVKEFVFGDAETSESAILGSLGSGESYLLRRSSALNSSDDIRRSVDLETARLIEEDENFVRNLLGTAPEFGEALDAQTEYNRLQEGSSVSSE